MTKLMQQVTRNIYKLAPYIKKILPSKLYKVVKKTYLATDKIALNLPTITTLKQLENETMSLANVNIIGEFKANTGLGQLARNCYVSFEQYQKKLQMINFSINDDKVENTLYNNKNLTNIAVINPIAINLAIKFFGKQLFENHYNIGYWSWELAQFPDEWQAAFDNFHEIWTLSEFCRAAIQAKTSKPVITMPCPVTVHYDVNLTRKHFNLPEDHYLFHFSFDFGSYSTRKNPQACIQAFQQAFPNKNDKVGLVIKSRSEQYGLEAYNYLNQISQEDPRIFIINKDLTNHEVNSIKNICDCFVSLHRAEGFGYNIAESMLLGKPCIATNYSGNSEFMQQDNSCLVNYSLIPVKAGEYLGDPTGQIWAEPDVEQAAWYMKKLFKDKTWGAELGTRAQNIIQTKFSPSIIGNQYEKRLYALGFKI